MKIHLTREDIMGTASRALPCCFGFALPVLAGEAPPEPFCGPDRQGV